MNHGIRLGAVVVLYNPEVAVYERVIKLTKVFSKVYLVDNSSSSNGEIVPLTREFKNLSYFPFLNNKGIAYALNFALQLAQKDSISFLCTLDQDSVYPISQQEKIEHFLSMANLGKDAIIALSPSSIKRNDNSEIEIVKNVITSGNFLNVRLLFEKGLRYNDELFIDYVDFDFCHKVHQAGLLVKQINAVRFDHTIGNPIIKRIFWHKFSAMNHSPVRDYYRYRNVTFLYRQDKKYYRGMYNREMTIEILKILVLEPEKCKKMRYILKGISDGKKMKLGPYHAF